MKQPARATQPLRHLSQSRPTRDHCLPAARGRALPAPTELRAQKATDPGDPGLMGEGSALGRHGRGGQWTSD